MPGKRGYGRGVGVYAPNPGANVFPFIVDGAGTGSNITVTGIQLDDTVFELLMFTGSGVPTSVIDVSEVSVTAANTIQLSTTVTTGHKLVGRYCRESLYPLDD